MGISDLGGAVSWGEAKLLVEEAASDPSTALGAELAEWSYPATIPALLTLIAAVGDRKASRAIMPWVLKAPDDGPQATPEQIAAAEAELDSEFVFT